MKQSSEKLSEVERNFLIALLDKGNASNADIAKKLKISKSSATRIRKKLEGRYVDEYIPIIPLEKVGINVFLVVMFKWNAFHDEKLTSSTFSALEHDYHVIFLANGEGPTNLSTVMFLGFRDLDEYHKYFTLFRKKYDTNMENITTLLLPSREVIKHDFTDLIKKVLKEGWFK